MKENMNDSISIKPWLFNEQSPNKYHVIVAALGYEERARFISEKIGLQINRKIASAFHTRKVLSYFDNEAWFKNAGYMINEVPDCEFKTWWVSELHSIIKNADTELNLCVDISSFNRFRTAVLIEGILEISKQKVINTDFVYAPAKFSVPSEDPGVMEICGPVTDKFAGWTDYPDYPVNAIVGIGYEPEKAVGVIEFLEPNKVWILVPSGEDKNYDERVREANRDLWDMFSPKQFISYEVSNPYEYFMILEGLVFGSLKNGRPILVPFGPKMFALCCLLVACVHSPYPGVWRVSSGDAEVPCQRMANGKIVGICTKFSPVVGSGCDPTPMPALGKGNMERQTSTKTGRV